MVKSIADVIDNLKTPNSLVVDVLSQGGFSGKDPEPRYWLSSGHIPGSVNIPFKQVLDGYRYKSENELRSIFKDSGVGRSTSYFLM